jgi:hypothetical protein
MLTSLVLSLSLAAVSSPKPGDAIYITESAPVTIDYAQLKDFKSAISAGFPGIMPDVIDAFSCWANVPKVKNTKAINLKEYAKDATWPCYAIDENPTKGAKAALDYELDTKGMCRIKDRPNGQQILLCEQDKMSDNAKLLGNALTESVFGLSLNRVFNFICARNKKKMVCRANPIEIEHPSKWMADIRDEKVKVIGLIGKVAPGG